MPTELVERAQAGDEDAFTQLAALSADRAYAVAYRVLRDAGRAEDATQQALITAWQRLRTLREPARFEAWLYRILTNACRDELRRRRSWESKARLVEGRPMWASDATVAVSDRDELERAFARLTVEHRAVVVMRHYLGWTTAEIAAALAIPEGTVASRLHYGVAALRRAIETDDRRPDRAKEAEA
jgi:RNA polymerase sigma-70 factor (ECF subfamily)